MNTLYYLAYGSNLHPARLKQRVPSSRSIGRVELPAYDLRFHKKGGDGSAKCDAFYTGNAGDLVYGAVYSMRANERYLLDAAEGLGSGYDLLETAVLFNSQPLEVFFYVADSAYVDNVLKPYNWYKALVVEGAKFHGFPAHTIQALQAVIAQDDLDMIRANKYLEILNSPT